jgi:NADH-quinone oxidoreductase subunit G
VERGGEIAAVESLAEALKAESDLIILFGDAVKGEAVRKLVAFGDSLGIPVKYVCLVDYANSRGALDMGLLPNLGPGYQPAGEAGLGIDQMLAAADLDVLWAVGANPLRTRALASPNAFVVVQDLFLTETAKRADVVLPAASAYEKTGTMTAGTGEVQKLKRGIQVVGAKPDLEIIGLLAREMRLDIGFASADRIFDEIRRTVPGYDVAIAALATGGAAVTSPVNGRIPADPRVETIRSARDTLFTSGTLGRYSKVLGSVLEAPGALYGGKPAESGR